MRLVCISDTHGLHDQVTLPPGDVLVHAGDFTSEGELEDVRAFLDWFGGVGSFGVAGGGVDMRRAPRIGPRSGRSPPTLAILRKSR